ncbi:ATP synthase F0 subunit B [bacterium]|jgi:F-type H+-transporting ATPase subunit b|nr:ATP synthase F0 subunit B [bacterium]
MIQPLFNFGETSSSGLGALGVDPKAFIVQLITFVLAFLVLRRFAFKPITKMMDDRRKLIESGVTIGEQMQKDQAKLEAKIAEELSKAREQADSILSAAQDEAKEAIKDAETKAREKADAILVDAKEKTKQDIARARKQLEAEVINLISDATEVIIGEKVDAKKDAQLIDKALKGGAN